LSLHGDRESNAYRAFHASRLLTKEASRHAAAPVYDIGDIGRRRSLTCLFSPEGDVFKSAPAFAVFERDLLDDVIPAIESRYSTHKEREYRALAGTVDGRRAIAEFRPREPPQVRMGGRLLLRAKHEEARRTAARTRAEWKQAFYHFVQKLTFGH
jgi:hypothetical protein